MNPAVDHPPRTTRQVVSWRSPLRLERNARSIRGELQPLTDGLCPDDLGLDGRMRLPRDVGDGVSRPVFKEGVSLTVAGHDVVTRLVVGSDDLTVENGRIKGRESERDERMEGRVHGRGCSGIGECSKYGRCMGRINVLGGVLSRKGVDTVHVL